MEYEKYIRERITSLRLKKNVSESRMSLDLGHSNSYIRNITSGKALPSLGEFLYICEYLGVTPLEFFSADIENAVLANKLYSLSKGMSDEDLQALIDIAERIKK